jgi:hypothetical protein
MHGSIYGDTGTSSGRSGRQWPLILAATGFNLLFEYSWRGANNIIQAPLVFVALFILYFTLFTILEDLIVEYRFRDYHLIIAAFFYGTIYEFFGSGALFYQPGFMGINWMTLFFANLVLWGSLQGVFTFYLANRVAPREPRPRLISGREWSLLLFLNIIALWGIRAGDGLPSPDITQWIALLAVLVISAFILTRAVLKKEWRAAYNPVRKSLILDLVGIITVVIFMISALFLTGTEGLPITAIYDITAWRIDLVWVLAVAVVLLVYRILKGESIPV